MIRIDQLEIFLIEISRILAWKGREDYHWQ